MSEKSNLDPIKEFKQDLLKAKQQQDANADYCTLASVSNDGEVRMRTLVLRSIEQEAFVFFINESSHKWHDLQKNSGEMLVFWPTLMTQYRIRGVFEPLSQDVVKEHWLQKPYQAKILDHYYQDIQSQSSELTLRNNFEQEIVALKQRYPDENKVPYPANVQGLVLQADYIEQWYGTADRLHKRRLFTLCDKQWQSVNLVP